MNIHRAAAVVALCAVPIGMASAQGTYPNGPVTLIVPFGAGSGTDIVTRSLAKHLGDAWKVPVIVENKPGANGALGAQAAARAKADGQTFLVGSATTNAANFAFYPGKLGYQSSSFEAVAGLSGGALALHVPASSPWKTVNDLVAAARSGSQPNLSCGSGNAVTQVACEIFKKQTGVASTTIPYKSNPASLTDLAGGQLSFAFSDAAASRSLVQGGKLRLLGVAGAQRNPAYAQVPTFAEQSLPGMQFNAWTAVFAPAGTHAAVTQKVNADVNRWLDSPEAAQLLAGSGSIALRMEVDRTREFVAAEVKRWEQYIRESNVQPE